MNESAPLFPDLPEWPRRAPAPLSVYRARNPALRTARDFCNRLVTERSPERKQQLYANMVAALLAKDGLNE
jgi:hypothetical protein